MMQSEREPIGPGLALRLSTLLLLVAAIAVGLGAWKSYWTPNRVWQRAIHGRDPAAQAQAWGSAKSGRIAGLTPEGSVEEVAATLEDSDDKAASTAIVVYPLVEPDVKAAASRLALRLYDGRAEIRRLVASTIRLVVRPDGSGRDQAVRPLIAALDDPDPGVRRTAALSLGDIAYRVGLPKLDRLETALHLHLADVDKSVRLAAALALARCGAGEESVPILAESLQAHRDDNCPESHCSIAFEALMVLAVRSDRATSTLIEGVYRESRGVSEETLTTLGAIALDYHARARMISRAKEALATSGPDLQLSAALTLARVDDGPAAAPALGEAFDRGTSRAKAVARSSLVRLASNDPEAIRSALADPSLPLGTRQALESFLPGR